MSVEEEAIVVAFVDIPYWLTAESLVVAFNWLLYGGGFCGVGSGLPRIKG
jgi:hypothetical protein